MFIKLAEPSLKIAGILAVILIAGCGGTKTKPAENVSQANVPEPFNNEGVIAFDAVPDLSLIHI